MYAYWVCAARETPIFSPEFPFRSILSSGASPFYSFFADFAVPETIIFKISLIIASHGRFSPPNAAPRVSQTRPCSSGESHFHAKTDQARSGAPHFQAQNGSSSFRRPPFSRSIGSSFRSPCQVFTLPRHIPTKIGGGGGGGVGKYVHNYKDSVSLSGQMFHKSDGDIELHFISFHFIY